MAFVVLRTQSFEDDYDSIIEYFIHELESPRTALDLIEHVDKAIDLLAETPFIHAISAKEPLHAHGYREHLVCSYVIVYGVDADEVRFVRMFHQRQLYEAQLRNGDSVVGRFSEGDHQITEDAKEPSSPEGYARFD